MLPVIITQIQGGLGNQLFIYAQARSMADRNNGILKLDPSLFSIDKVYKRKFLLDNFNIRINEMLPQKNDLKLKLSRIRCKIYRNRCFSSGNWIYEPEPKVYLEQIVRWKGTEVKLNGYWQNEDYFKDNRLQIAKDLTLLESRKIEQSTIAQDIISKENAVFLHIRTYREVPGKSDGSFALPMYYYIKSVDFINRSLPNAHFYLFSDDHDWVQIKLNLPADIKITFVKQFDKSVDSTLTDFHLMSLCNHGIVANSSFSWWSGWLCEQRNIALGRKSLIICPDNFPVSSFYPVRWQKI